MTTRKANSLSNKPRSRRNNNVGLNEPSGVKSEPRSVLLKMQLFDSF